MHCDSRTIIGSAAPVNPVAANLGDERIRGPTRNISTRLDVVVGVEENRWRTLDLLRPGDNCGLAFDSFGGRDPQDLRVQARRDEAIAHVEG